MNKAIYLSILALGMSASAQAPVAVTATVTGANGAPYAFGSVRATLVDASNNPIQTATIGGQAITQVSFSGGLSSTGSFSLNLYPNGQLDQSTSQWRFYVCSAPPTLNLPLVVTAQQCFTSRVTITAAGSISTTLNAAAPAVYTFNPNGTSYPTTTSANIMSVMTVTGCTVTGNICTVNTAGNSVTFSNIPSGFTNLKIYASGAVGSNAEMLIQFNGDTGSNYADSFNRLTSTTQTGQAATSATSAHVGTFLASTLGSETIIEIPFYSTTTTLGRLAYFNGLSTGNVVSSTTSNTLDQGVAYWNGSATINSITLLMGAGVNMNTGMVFTVQASY